MAKSDKQTTVRLELLHSSDHPDATGAPGDIIDCPAELAERFIAGRGARLVTAAGKPAPTKTAAAGDSAIAAELLARVEALASRLDDVEAECGRLRELCDAQAQDIESLKAPPAEGDESDESKKSGGKKS